MGGGGQSYALLNPELCVEQQSLTASTDLKSPIEGLGTFPGGRGLSFPSHEDAPYTLSSASG